MYFLTTITLSSYPTLGHCKWLVQHSGRHPSTCLVIRTLVVSPICTDSFLFRRSHGRSAPCHRGRYCSLSPGHSSLRLCSVVREGSAPVPDAHTGRCRYGPSSCHTDRRPCGSRNPPCTPRGEADSVPNRICPCRNCRHKSGRGGNPSLFRTNLQKNEKLSVAIKNLSIKVYTFETFGSWNGDEWASSFPIDVLCLT